MRASFLSAANLLSLSRIPMAAAVWIAPGSLRLLLPLIAAAAVTDWLDGLVARHRAAGDAEVAGPRSTGAWLDPLCDKIFIVSTLVAVWWAVRPDGWLVVLIAARDILIVPLALTYWLVPRLRALDIDLRAGKLGKATTVAQFAAVLALLLLPEAIGPLAVVAAVLGVGAAGAYAARGLAALGAPEQAEAGPHGPTDAQTSWGM